MPKLVMVRVSKLIPMREVERPYYDPDAYKHLKACIEQDGFKKADAVSGRWSEKKQKYEIFAGTHRLQVAQELKLKRIPMWKYSGDELTRVDAIAEGYLENATHAAYNPMDKTKLFVHLRNLYRKRDKRKGIGRKPTKYLEKIAKRVHVSVGTVQNHFYLDELPIHTQGIIGRGKLRLRQALALHKLVGTEHEEEINSLADRASKGFSSPIAVESLVKSVLNGTGSGLTCNICGKKHDSLEKYFVCSRCEEKKKLRKR